MKLENLESILGYLQEAVARQLHAEPGGLSEHALMQALSGQPQLSWMGRVRDGELSLFQRHFLLFHVLYRLQEQGWAEAGGNLEISPLCIRWRAYEAGTAGLKEADPLRNYYLDLANLHNTSAEDVSQMLDQFWRRYLAGEGRVEALQVLGLEEPVDRRLIEKRYRELAATHHPDRGGDAGKQAEINKAMEILRQYYPQSSR